MLLVGDIGGTNTRLALIDRTRPVIIQHTKKYLSVEYKGLLEIIKLFLEEFSITDTISGASFGIAGPIRNQRVEATNLSWIIDAKELSEKLKIESVYLINDLEANAYGLFVLEEKDFHVLNKGKEQLGNQALISAGTGLGEAGLIYGRKTHIPFACEGGHCDFAPRNDLEIELLKFARQNYPHVSYERFLSGDGIHFIYQFLIKHHKKSHSSEMKNLFENNNPASVISKKAIEENDPLCSETLDLFISIYGAEAGNLALKFLALGGLFIGGGIAPKIIDKMKDETFFKAFIDKGRFAGLLASIPIKIVLNDRAALLGAAEYLLRKIS